MTGDSSARLDALLALQPSDYMQVDCETIADLSMIGMFGLAVVGAFLANTLCCWAAAALGLVYYAHASGKPMHMLMALPLAAGAFCYYRRLSQPTRGFFD